MNPRLEWRLQYVAALVMMGESVTMIFPNVAQSGHAARYVRNLLEKRNVPVLKPPSDLHLRFIVAGPFPNGKIGRARMSSLGEQISGARIEWFAIDEALDQDIRKFPQFYSRLSPNARPVPRDESEIAVPNTMD